jgi:hypothetical protein
MLMRTLNLLRITVIQSGMREKVITAKKARVRSIVEAIVSKKVDRSE